MAVAALQVVFRHVDDTLHVVEILVERELGLLRRHRWRLFRCFPFWKQRQWHEDTPGRRSWNSIMHSVWGCLEDKREGLWESEERMGARKDE